MTNWRENPGLFTIGDFKLKVKGLHHDIQVTFWHLCDFNNLIEDCTLIARRIESITDEEVREIEGVDYAPEVCELRRLRWAKDAKINQMLGKIERALLDRGVFPFPWPDDGSVIEKEIK